MEITGDETLKGLAVGSHRLTVYARDEDGIENSATIYFTIAEGAEPPQSESFPITWVIVIIVIAVVGAALLFYFMRSKKKTWSRRAFHIDTKVKHIRRLVNAVNIGTNTE